jgi:hypothetical protein
MKKVKTIAETLKVKTMTEGLKAKLQPIISLLPYILKSIKWVNDASKLQFQFFRVVIIELLYYEKTDFCTCWHCSSLCMLFTSYHHKTFTFHHLMRYTLQLFNLGCYHYS